MARPSLSELEVLHAFGRLQTQRCRVQRLRRFAKGHHPGASDALDLAKADLALALRAAAARACGVVTASAGNHGQAVAYHAGRLGISATIVMPRFTPNVKVQHTEGFGAEGLLRGNDLSEAGACAAELVRERGLTFVHPYDDPAVIAGQGTAALELLQDREDLAAVIAPVSTIWSITQPRRSTVCRCPTRVSGS